MSLWFTIFALAILVLIPLTGSGITGLQAFFGIVIPYAAILTFLVGFVFKILKWTKSPVPFRIPTTSGQEKTLPWIKYSKFDNPFTIWGVIGRMAAEILFFRSLFRNTKAEIKEGPRVAYGSNKLLWAAGLAFHYSFLIIFLRHFKYFVEPIPWFVSAIQYLDGWFQVGLPLVYLTDVLIFAGLGYLLLRRLYDAKLRYMSHASDWFPLLLIAGIAATGVLMRYFIKVDIVSVKELGAGLLALKPILPEGISSLFYTHLFLVSTLIAYFPFSKLMHLGGVFLTPTRNLANNNRAKQHVNPWNYDVKVHTYEEYEEEFRDVMKAAGLPLEKE